MKNDTENDFLLLGFSTAHFLMSNNLTSLLTLQPVNINIPRIDWVCYSGRLHIGLIVFLFMNPVSISFHKHAKKELGRHPATFTGQAWPIFNLSHILFFEWCLKLNKFWAVISLSLTISELTDWSHISTSYRDLRNRGTVAMKNLEKELNGKRRCKRFLKN